MKIQSHATQDHLKIILFLGHDLCRGCLEFTEKLAFHENADAILKLSEAEIGFFGCISYSSIAVFRFQTLICQ